MPSPRRSVQSAARARSRATQPGAAADVPAQAILFQARLLKPLKRGPTEAWLFLLVPPEASRQLPSRGLNSVAGTLAGAPFQATLEPDGQGGHWLRVEPELAAAAGVGAGETVSLEVMPLDVEPEPRLPVELQQALAAASDQVRAAWADITPVARRDWIHWIASAKRPETRQKRIVSTCDMLAQGKRRPCCFDRSGMFSRSLRVPEAES
ncbi:MAG: YdeI/OmpD-associated family protein [Planctomycetaceae bacterium]